MPNYDPNSDDYHYPPRHEPDAELDRLRAELRDWQTSSEAYRHDAERAQDALGAQHDLEKDFADARARAEKAEARVVELEALCTAQHGAVARAERAEAERDALREALQTDGSPTLRGWIGSCGRTPA